MTCRPDDFSDGMEDVKDVIQDGVLIRIIFRQSSTVMGLGDP